MRLFACAMMTASVLFSVSVLAAPPAFAQADRTAAAFWKSVQSSCDASASKPASELGRRIARTAIEEFTQFGGHQIDSNGRLFRFGLTEGQQEKDFAGGPQANLGDLGWWRVMKYWRALYGKDTLDMIEALGYRDASTAMDEGQSGGLLRVDAGPLLRALEATSDPVAREVLREAALRAAVIDTPWSAAFVSYVIRQAGATADAFHFSNAHRAYIYDAFATSAAEATNAASKQIYRACPVTTTRPRVGDLICHQREPALATASDTEVRERIRTELAGNSDTRSVRRTHCDVIAHIDARAHKMYIISGNVYHAVSARKLNLRRNLTLSARQHGNCSDAAHWSLPQPATATAVPSSHTGSCSLNDRKWFVLLQLR